MATTTRGSGRASLIQERFLCAYCDLARRLTREHIWGDAVEQAFRELAPHTHFSAKFPDGVKGDMQIGDVCRPCNGSMSPLDSHGVELVRSYFIRSFELTAPVAFDYGEYRFFSRWLLKILYNDARATNTRIEDHRQFRKYILGIEAPPRAFTLFGGLLKPQKLPANLAATVGVTRMEPRENRIATIDFRGGGPRYVETLQLGRIVSFYGFIFTLFVWKDGIDRTTRSQVQLDYQISLGLRMLRSDRTTLDLRYSRLSVIDMALGPKGDGARFDKVFRPRLVDD